MSDILSDVESGVLSIRLNRPAKKNALTDAMYGHLAELLNEAASAPEIGVVLVSGEGADFCAGNDLSMFAEAGTSGPDIESSNTEPFLQALSTFPKPLVAAVTGRAIGVGVTMLFHYDLVFVAADAQLRMPFIDLGLVPEAGAAYLLPSLVGHQRAFEIFALNKPISGEIAVNLGIANTALAAPEVRPAALEAATRLAAKPTSALIATKKLMRNAPSLAKALTADRAAMLERLKSPEAMAAFEAFLGKAHPSG